MTGSVIMVSWICSGIPSWYANIYACEQEQTPVLEITSSMDIGEHPAVTAGNIYILSNADSVKMYKNDRFIKEYLPGMSPYKRKSTVPS